MKLCPFCGRAIEDDARYCSGCGKKINEHDEITHNPITEAMLHYDEMPDVITKRKREIVRCPRCGRSEKSVDNYKFCYSYWKRFAERGESNE